MYFTQLNLHKAKLAAIELHNKLQGRHDIALLAEPYLFRNKIVGLPTGYKAFVPTPDEIEGRQQARVAILAPKDLGLIQIDTLCSGDCVVAQFLTDTGLLVVASIYMDIKK